MSPSLLDFLKHIEHECSFILRVSKGKNRDEILNDELLCKGLVRSIEIIGEAIKKIDGDFKLEHPNVEWKKIAGTRDIMIHHYFGIDYDIVLDIIENKIPELQHCIKKIIEIEETGK